MHLQAPEHWHCIDFISDLHLQAGEPSTFSAWQNYVRCTRADALFILGDLFEVWIGDDVLRMSSSFEARCARILKETSARINIFVMHGNRDFLMNTGFVQASGATLIEDPTLLNWAGGNYVLVHGDAQCLDDVEYMQFRSMVRSDAWQKSFLAKPLFEREKIARGMRAQSETKKLAVQNYADVDANAVSTLLQNFCASHLIHGHTHKPARYALSDGHIRDVLSDWDISANPPRSEVLRLWWSGRTGDIPLMTRIDPATESTLSD